MLTKGFFAKNSHFLLCQTEGQENTEIENLIFYRFVIKKLRH